MVKPEKSIVLFGAGNLASHLAPALQKAGYKFLQVLSRNFDSASVLAGKLGALAETDFSKLIPDADYYIICVCDSEIENVIQNSVPKGKFLIHTSGSTPMSIFNNYCSRFGVLYPLQTFSKSKKMNMRQVPFFVEASSANELEEISRMAGNISDFIRPGNSEQRLYLHICAVFTCAFTNHMYRIAEEICKEKGLPFEFLHPLLLETAEKASHISPGLVQTGPAARNDEVILKKHMDMLDEYPEFRKIYTFVTSSILKMNGHSTEFLNSQTFKDE
jgi:predicted short-subunit dehydrogenase-like oxidoreductase (DUF2520 family)